MNIKLIMVLITTSIISGCVIGNQYAFNGENASVTLGNIGVKDGQQAGRLSSVNGNVEVGSNASVGAADTVNGNVEIGHNSQTKSLSTINGAIEIGSYSIVDGEVSTVNGEITLDNSAQVKGTLRITNGHIKLKDNAKVSGNIIFEHTNFSGVFNGRTERTLEIADSAIVEGNVILYTPTKLILPDGFDQTKIDKRFVQKK